MTLLEGEVPFMITERLAGVYNTIYDTPEKQHPANTAVGSALHEAPIFGFPLPNPFVSAYAQISNLPRELGNCNLPFRSTGAFGHSCLLTLPHTSLFTSSIISLCSQLLCWDLTHLGICELYMSPNFTKNNLQGFMSLTLLLSYWSFPEWYE